MKKSSESAIFVILVCSISILAATFQEIDGVVSIDAEHYSAITGNWEMKPAPSGGAVLCNDGCLDSINPETGKRLADDYVRYDINFKTTGTYYLWALSTWGGWDGANDLKVWLDTPSDSVHGAENEGRDFELMLFSHQLWKDDWYKPVMHYVGMGTWGWSNKAKDKSRTYTKKLNDVPSCQWDIDSPGIHSIHFVKGHEPEHCRYTWNQLYGIDKFVLVRDGMQAPDSLGPRETTWEFDTLRLKAMSDFELLTGKRGITYYKEQTRSMLAIDASKYKGSFAKARHEFYGKGGEYDITIAVLTENDGESTYKIAVDGDEVQKSFRPEPGKRWIVRHTWKKVPLKNRAHITVSSNAHTNKKLKDPDGSPAYSRGRWQELVIVPSQ